MSSKRLSHLRLSHLLLALPVLLASGCGVASAGETSHTPAPVTDKGMTLDWGQDVKASALKLIESAQHVCYLDMYELSDTDILNALSAARRRGVDVRVIVDATEPHSQKTGMPTLQHDGVPVEAFNVPRGISHIKMLIADGTVLIGGMNFGAQSWNNNDASVVIANANSSFIALFRWDWQRAAGQPAPAPGYQLPLIDDRQTEQVVEQAIQQATKRVSLEAFDLSDHGVLSALLAACQRGVQVEVLLDPSQSYNRSSADALKAAGATVRYYQPYNGELMHAKILDVDEGKVFLIGSANFSHQAYTYNHEGDVELRDVPLFDAAFQQNLSAQLARGSDSPSATSRQEF
ncbi:phosphatidylserine/phosphatidylglycerophosphate/cardiolipin synthase family protein [Alicyclobacillus cycloheptanicus]|jgi:cardiolipin synthase|uniref:phospholipase D n=1 Tax=Alicyclobacillus cycloheptanicus TaxID=1457 RepID=A0ABT9XF14_9BACL|nr:phosphatidylserine/phosphatidylglycerophosphate/cardiolipin synthase family protein [Alicyclobacillus cycloheptanicus]MDQ0188894.1 cardiolipin synthase [Alicyclobacillus cycloheptanicus]WDM01751.1 phosphatidylserine/phosphatidylglycerophosphate/cardiolipin synthase family protein [Alicyclobacillus cycloheptanicus]